MRSSPQGRGPGPVEVSASIVLSPELQTQTPYCYSWSVFQLEHWMALGRAHNCRSYADWQFLRLRYPRSVPRWKREVQ